MSTMSLTSQSHTQQQTTFDGQISTSPPKKLRLSCDACLAAKVKCAKERPVCARCLAHGRACNYSTTRRVGKPKGCCKKTPSDAKTQQQACPPNVSKSMDAGNDMLRRHSITTNWDELGWDSTTPNTDDRHFAPSSYSSASLVDFDPSAMTHQSYECISAIHNMGLDSQLSASSYTHLFSPMSTSASDWRAAVGSVIDQGQSPLDTFSRTNSTVDMMCTSDNGSVDITVSGTPRDSVVSMNGLDQSGDCSCRASLQQRIHSLTASLPFDELMSMNQNVYFSMFNYLSCTCRPDISSIMLLSSIVSQLVQVYKTIYQTEVHPASQTVVTVGMLRIDSFDEHRIKLMLVRSELVKVRELIRRFPDRFENYLDGPERRIYRVNMEYLQNDLDNMISKGALMLNS